MPRRKRTFIQRSKANNYQLVHRPTSTDPHRHILVSEDGAANEASPTQSAAHVIETNELDTQYKTEEYELGEYGFPDDGYDYSKHFRSIGGGGGVYIDAATGMPDPDAVTGRTSAQPVDDKHSEAVMLREEVEQPQEETNTDWRNPEDVMLQEQAIEQIKRDKKYDADLQDVFKALDSDGELRSTTSADDDEIRDDEPPPRSDFAQVDDLNSDDTAALEDDFIALADEDTVSDCNSANEPIEPEKEFGLAGIVEGYREPRLLDSQFDEFMKGYEQESSDDDVDVEGLKRFARNDADREPVSEDIYALLAENEKEAFGMGEEEFELLNGFSELNCLEEEDAAGNAGRDADLQSEIHHDDGKTTERQQQFESYTNAEFERGLQGVLDAYVRVPVTEALDADEGVEGARRAIARQETEDKHLLDRRIELGQEDDDHDSDLDTLFDEMYKDNGDKWDCQTIVSTYSNAHNNPSVIDAPSSSKHRKLQNRPIICLDARTQAPKEFIPTSDVAASSRQEVDFGSRRIVRVARTVRERGESKDEKKARKNAVKEDARERRALKSEMKKAFRAEDVKQNAHAASLGNAKVSMQF